MYANPECASLRRTLTRASAAAWAGVISIAGLMAWFAAVGLRYLLAGHDLWRAVQASAAIAVGPAVVFTVSLLLVAEQLWPAVPRPLFARAHFVDAFYLGLVALAVVPLTLVETGFNHEVVRNAPFLTLGRLPLVPRAVVAVILLVAIDAMNWCGHVANHRFLALWRLHALHHSQEDMGVLTTFRIHPLVHASYLPALLPGLVLLNSGTVPSTALLAYGCMVAFTHANLPWRLGPLGRVVVSPAYHRIHHARELGGRGTVNFGFALVIWDRLTRRAEFPVGPPRPTGLANRPVPVEQIVGMRRLPALVVAQLAQPLRLYAATDGPQ
jgi:sterol desaturase/sphingolipid hydroxylase (fatty acid hydroxylase superfamily)